MSHRNLFDVDVLRVPGRYWLTLTEIEDAENIINLLAKSANLIQPGSLGILEVKPVLINNLRAWENLILPHWYHDADSLHHNEQQLNQLLLAMEVDLEKLMLLMGKLPGQLDLAQRRVVAMLRVVLQHAPTWVVEEDWLEWWSDTKGRNPMLAKMYQHIVLPESLVVLSTRSAQPSFQSICLSMDVLV